MDFGRRGVSETTSAFRRSNNFARRKCSLSCNLLSFKLQSFTSSTFNAPTKYLTSNLRPTQTARVQDDCHPNLVQLISEMSSYSKSASRLPRVARKPKQTIPYEVRGQGRGPVYSISPQKLLLYADRGLVVVNKPNGMIAQLGDPGHVNSVCAPPHCSALWSYYSPGTKRRYDFIQDIYRGYARVAYVAS